MLEHPDRDDAVELTLHLTVVEKLEADGLGKALGASALLRCSELLLAQGDSGHVDMGGFGEIEAKAAPAGADVENFQSVAEIELGGKVALLGGLRLLERHALLLEISAGILPVAVEEQLVETVIEIVMVLDVALGPSGRVVLPQATPDESQALAQTCQARPRGIVEI